MRKEDVSPLLVIPNLIFSYPFPTQAFLDFSGLQAQGNKEDE